LAFAETSTLSYIKSTSTQSNHHTVTPILKSVCDPTANSTTHIEPQVKTKHKNTPTTMKFAAASTLLFATLALASPAPAAQPDTAVAPVAQPQLVERAPLPVLEARKKSKPKGGSNSNSTGAATTMTPSRALQLGAVGLGVMEVARLWG
jgi:hypothetical protein